MRERFSLNQKGLYILIHAGCGSSCGVFASKESFLSTPFLTHGRSGIPSTKFEPSIKREKKLGPQLVSMKFFSRRVGVLKSTYDHTLTFYWFLSNKGYHSNDCRIPLFLDFSD